jgi:ATP synthase H subunit
MFIRKLDALLEVKKAEESVEKLKQDAMQEKERIIKESRREALKIIDDAKAEAQTIQKTKMDVVQREIEELKKRIIGEGELRAKDLEAKAGANLDNAVDMIVKKFEGEVGNAKT